jgi:hypothetical protein
VFDEEECSDKGGEERAGGGVFHRNALGELGSFSLWMWWETIVEGAKDSAAKGKRIRRDNMSSTAVGSNPSERWKGRGGRWSSMIVGSSQVVKLFFHT